MTRRELRENVFKMLFRIEFHETGEFMEQLQLFIEDLENSCKKSSKKDWDYLTKKYQDICAHVDELDAAINEKSKGWKTDRMSKVDLTLIRLAVYEIQMEEDIPAAVSINEAVELAKKYGTDNSASFVNGILAKFA